MKNVCFKLFLVFVLIGSFTPALAALPQIKKGEHQYLDLHFLVQPWFLAMEEGAADSSSWSKDVFLRRTRFILSGSVHERVKFFVETDIPNLGKGGNWSSSFYIQDAYIDFLLSHSRGWLSSLHVAAGMILLPFSHHNRQSAVSLNTLDYHITLIRFPADSHKVWRDTGVEARALLCGKRLDVRAGIFDGVPGSASPGLNPRDLPRFTGRVQYNFWEPEEGFFYGGNYLGTKRVLSGGIGFDCQQDAVYTGNHAAPGGYWAATADLFVDYPLSKDREIVFQANAFHYAYGDENAYRANMVPKTGNALGMELGYRWGKLQPVISYERFEPKYEAAQSLYFAENLRLGFNWWWLGHSANFKFEYAVLQKKDKDLKKTTRGAFSVQAQLFF